MLTLISNSSTAASRSKASRRTLDHVLTGHNPVRIGNLAILVQSYFVLTLARIPMYECFCGSGPCSRYRMIGAVRNPDRVVRVSSFGSGALSPVGLQQSFQVSFASNRFITAHSELYSYMRTILQSMTPAQRSRSMQSSTLYRGIPLSVTG